ncbi:polysaccharide deacetylase family protein [Salibacteraceae bacterium]|nr:polysaccharide deacetylase family protein [Salibacteraceae bacterium]
MMEKLKSALKPYYYKVQKLLSSDIKLERLQSALILNYHHIVPDSVMERNLLYGYNHTTSSFESQIEWMSARFKNSLEFEDKNSFVITFDDCSIHTIDQALPILTKFKVQAYFFVVEDRIGKSIWIDDYFFWLSYVPNGSYKLFNRSYNIKNQKSRLEIHQEIWKEYQHAPNHQFILSELDTQYSLSKLKSTHSTHCKRLVTLSRDDIFNLKKLGHLVGFHSQTHDQLSKLNEAGLSKECQYSNSDLFNCSAFAIPFGSENDYNDSAISSIKNLGYKSILLNHAKKAQDNVYGRLNLPDSTDKLEIEFKTKEYINAIS